MSDLRGKRPRGRWFHYPLAPTRTRAGRARRHGCWARSFRGFPRLGWVVTSIVFGLYLNYVAAYDSVFGQLATVYIGFQHVALSAIVYVAGLVVDALAIRSQPPPQSRA